MSPRTPLSIYRCQLFQFLEPVGDDDDLSWHFQDSEITAPDILVADFVAQVVSSPGLKSKALLSFDTEPFLSAKGISCRQSEVPESGFTSA